MLVRGSGSVDERHRDDGGWGSCGCVSCLTGHGLIEPAAGLDDGAQGLSSSQSSGVSQVDALVLGSAYKWGPVGLMGAATTVTYSFMASAPSYAGYDGSFEPFNATMKAATRTAMDAWSSAADITFVEVADSGSGGQIRFGSNTQSSTTAGYAYYPGTSSVAGDVWVNNANWYNLAPVVGNYGYFVLLHEIGHAIGLKHPGNYNATGGGTSGPYLSATEDSRDYTVMSYYGGTPTTLKSLDIQAAQYLYGTSGTGSIGNVHFFDGANDSYAGTGGIDYVHARGGDDRVDLGAGNDGVMAGDGADTVLGGSGNDLIYGNVGLDVLSGGAGNDTIFGGQNAGGLDPGETGVDAYRSGVDTISGGVGNDLIYGNHGPDRLVGGAGSDTLYGGQDADTLSGGEGFDRLFGNLGADLMAAGGGTDTLYGGAGADTLSGGGGSDYLFGEAGADLMVGGDSYDRFYIANDGGADTISDFEYLRDYLVFQRNLNGSGITSFSTMAARASQVGDDVVIDLGAGNSLTLSGYTVGKLSSFDTLFY
jgi:serralysin